jgi:hypothetical protein
MTTAAPSPLTPAACDLRNFLRMPLEVGRLLASDTWIQASHDPRLGHALVSLWCEAWRQVPAGSLPDVDMTLQSLSMCHNPKEWARIRDRVLAGWVRASDGRLYHPVVCEMALEAWLEKLVQRRKSGAGNAKRHGGVADFSQIDADIVEARALLQALNPNCPALHKRRGLDVPVPTRGAASSPPRGTPPPVPQGSFCDPTGSPQGSHGDPCAIPQGSQEKGRDISPIPFTSPPVDNFGAATGPNADAPRPPMPGGRWWDNRQGVEQAGQALGVGPWDERAFSVGQGPQWPTYRDAVLQAAGIGPWSTSAARQPTQVAGLLRVGGVH